MKINKQFKDLYLTCDEWGNDNNVFVNCPEEMIAKFKLSFSKLKTQTKPCVVCLTSKNEEKLNLTLNYFSRDLYRDILACDYLNCLIMIQLMDIFKIEKFNDLTIQDLKEMVRILEIGDYEKAKLNHLFAPMQFDIDSLIAKVPRVQLVIMLKNVESKNIYHALNNYLGTRCHYPISVFTTGERLANSYMSNGQLVEPVHDYRLINVENFLENEAEIKC